MWCDCVTALYIMYFMYTWFSAVTLTFPSWDELCEVFLWDNNEYQRLTYSVITSNCLWTTQIRLFWNSNELWYFFFLNIVGLRYQCVPWNVMNFEYVNSSGLARTTLTRHTAQQAQIEERCRLKTSGMNDFPLSIGPSTRFIVLNIEYTFRRYDWNLHILEHSSKSGGTGPGANPGQAQREVGSGLSKIKRWNPQLTNPLGTRSNCLNQLEKYKCWSSDRRYVQWCLLVTRMFTLFIKCWRKKDEEWSSDERNGLSGKKRLAEQE